MTFTTVPLLLSLAVAAMAVIPDDFLSRNAGDKRDYVWKQILDAKYSCPLPISIVPDSQITDPDFLIVSFNLTLEELPPGRPKLVGTNGNAAKITLTIGPDSPYTGLFEAGSVNVGIMRLSSNTAVNLVSYLAMKFYVDKSVSPTFHLLHDVIGWSQLNDMVDYFQWNMTTGIPVPLQADIDTGRYSLAISDAFEKTIAKLPGGPLDRPGSVWAFGSVEHAERNNKGVAPAKVYAPWYVQVVPQVSVKVSPKNDDWRKVITDNIKPNTLLYKVQAKKSPCDDWVDLGEVRTESEFVASAYHDKYMRFGQPVRQWDYGVAAPGVSCTKDPNALPTWPQPEADLMEKLADNLGKDGLSYGNSPNVVAGFQNGTGISTGACPMSAANGGSYSR